MRRAEINGFYSHFQVTSDLLELRNLVQVPDLIVLGPAFRAFW